MKKIFSWKNMSFFLIVGILFCVRFVWYEKVHYSKIPSAWFSETSGIEGWVTDDPDRGLESTKVRLGDIGIDVTLPKDAQVRYEDRIKFYGKVKSPKAFTTDTYRVFDYPQYLAIHDIYGTITADTFSVIDHKTSKLFEILFSLKKIVVDKIKEILPYEEAGLFAGIFIGEKSLLTKNIQQDFQIAGLSHMVVLSGYNITIVATFVMVLFAWLGFGYKGRRVGALIIIPLFIIMTGFGASSVRAGIMSMMIFGLQILVRPANSGRVIFYTAAIIGFSNPRILLYDPSFHLSFLAFIGLVYVTPFIEKLFSRFGEWFGLRDLLVQTLSVQLFVLPYILWMSGRVSLLILLSNLLTVPLVPLATFFGGSVILVSFFIPSIAPIIAYPVVFLMQYMINVSRLVALSSPTTITFAPFNGWIIVVGYGLLMIGILFCKSVILTSSS